MNLGIIHFIFKTHCVKTEDPQLIFSAIDEFGGVQVKEASGVRSLHLDNEVIQSCMSTKDPSKPMLEYIQAMGLAFYAPSTITNILILGGGGGSLVNLARQLHPDSYIDVVERSGAVVRAASEAMLMCEDSRINVHISDALSFLKSGGSEQIYDLIFIDLFDSDGPALDYYNIEFSAHVTALLKPTGNVVANLWKQARRSSKLLIDNISSSLGLPGLRWPLPSGLNVIFYAGASLDRETLPDWKSAVLQSKTKNYPERMTLIEALYQTFNPISGR